MNKKKPIIDEEEIKKSSFKLEDIKIREFKSKNSFSFDSSDGVTEINTSINKKVENSDFTKLYKENKQNRDLLLTLGREANWLFIFITYEIETGKDYLWINKALFLEKTKLRSKDYNKAIKELLVNNILNVTLYDEVYCVNTSFVYSGDRLKHYNKQNEKQNNN